MVVVVFKNGDEALIETGGTSGDSHWLLWLSVV
jgi:hypothetical protein